MTHHNTIMANGDSAPLIPHICLSRPLFVGLFMIRYDISILNSIKHKHSKFSTVLNVEKDFLNYDIKNRFAV